MKVTHTIIALVMLLGLGGIFYYLNQQPKPPDPNEIPKAKLFSLQADQVEEFSIEVPNQPLTTFRRVAAPAAPKTGANAKPEEKAAAPWEIVAPTGVVAATGQIQAFVDG